MNEKLLFFDIETHRVKNWSDLSPALRKAFEAHVYNDNEKNIYANVEQCFNEKAALHAEFSQVICVSLGYEYENGFRVLSFSGRDEVKILTELSETLDNFKNKWYSLAGHNINGFDKPYLAKRYIINKMQVPKILNSMGLKPWEISDVDTMQVWKFGSWSATSLEVISAALGIQCKSTEISGSNMYKYDIENMNWAELKMYCEEDVKSCYQIYKRIFYKENAF